MLFEAEKSLLGDIVFDLAGVLGSRIPVNADIGEEFGKKLVSFVDHYSDLLT